MNFNFKQNYPGEETILRDLLDPLFRINKKPRREDVLKSNPEYTKDAEQAKILKIIHIGTYELDIDPIEIFDVTLDESARISQSRVSIQRAIRRMLRKYTASLIFFHYENNEGDWRLSFLYKDKTLYDTTPAKRYTYLLGPERDCRTVTERFTLLESKTKNVENILAAFSVEVLTKEFYRKLFDWYLWAVKCISFPQVRPEDDEMLEDSVHQSESLIRLLTRILFVWFMKEKGLINDELFNDKALPKILKGFLKNDGNETVYYKAILQNLFFATLNKPVQDRKIIKDVHPNPDYGDPLVYRYRELFSSPDDILTYFKNIPFLNGGLFDCLDRKADSTSKKETRLDGFSKVKSKQPIVPDKLFFGEHHGIDLSRDYDDKNKKNVTVTGLIDILKLYNFTIEENTPIDQEIALDPELLGKVFENLLASYNPETKTTARKQTGSFYTPREIVEYMVDESIIAYLKNTIDDETRLRKLVSYNGNYSDDDKENPFSENETRHLIEAIDNMKALDPACGSGAFPMGLLQKLVYILHKLDPDNGLWLEKVVGNAPKAFQNEIRNKMKGESLDYVRKLGIVQQCIYGIDIQPIATQIAKLRFFISLLVDQHEKSGLPNWGFDPLPNLDFKIVSANTLIKAPEWSETATGLFEGTKDEYFDSFERLTDEYFSASTPDEKNRLKTEITKLITKKTDSMIQFIEENFKKGLHKNFDGEKTDKNAKVISEKENDIRLWKSYTNLFKHEAVGFFETKYFFPKVKEGFDVVIGNPPYVDAKRLKPISNYLKNHYETYTGSSDLFVYFYECGIKITKNNGILSLITSNKWIRSEYGRKLRNFIIRNNNPLYLVDFVTNRVFDATVDCNIIIISKSKNTNQLKVCTYFDKLSKTDGLADYILNHYEKSPELNDEVWLLSTNKNISIKTKIEKCGKPLKEYGNAIYRGILTGFNDAFIIKEDIKNYLIEKDIKNVELLKPLIQGKDIRKYQYSSSNLWLINTHNGNKERKIPPIQVKNDFPIIYKHLEKYLPKIQERTDKGIHWSNLRNCAYLEEFEKEKIIWQGVAKRIEFSYDTENVFTDVTTFFMTGSNLKYILSIFNSKLMKYALLNIYLEGDTFKSKNKILQNFPIPLVSTESKSIIIAVVDQILSTKKTDPYADTSALEKQIDELVYKLYDLTPEEIAIVEESVK